MWVEGSVSKTGDPGSNSETLKELAFEIPDGVERVKHRFEVENDTVAADVYRPVGATPLPGVVFAGPLSSVKEQSTGAYASALALHGFVCVSLGHRTFGESDGVPRQYESYAIKIADIGGAVNWLASLPEVDAARLGTCGVCLGAAYSARVTVENPLVKAAGFVVPLFPIGGEPSTQGVAARELYEQTGEVLVIPAASVTEDAAMPMQIAVDYYSDPQRALVQNYRNEVALMYRERWQEFNGQASAVSLTKPLVMVHGEQSFAMRSGTTFFERAGSEHKALHWINGLAHTDFYDNPSAIRQIAQLLSAHFAAHA